MIVAALREVSTPRKVVNRSVPSVSLTRQIVTSSRKEGKKRMQVIHPRCAAIDVHKKTAVTTIMLTQPDGTVQKRTRTFATMTADLLALDDWLKRQGIEVIALE